VQARLTAWLGSIWGWVLTALLFTLWSVPDKLVQWGTASPANLALGLAAALGTGLVCGWIMNKSGNILAPWLYRAFSAWTAVL
jgi:membrane protease YdiL (CAAX protease family)